MFLDFSENQVAKIIQFGLISMNNLIFFLFELDLLLKLINCCFWNGNKEKHFCSVATKHIFFYSLFLSV